MRHSTLLSVGVEAWDQPLQSPETPILIPSNFVPENGFPVVKALNSNPVQGRHAGAASVG